MRKMLSTNESANSLSAAAWLTKTLATEHPYPDVLIIIAGVSERTVQRWRTAGGRRPG